VRQRATTDAWNRSCCLALVLLAISPAVGTPPNGPAAPPNSPASNRQPCRVGVPAVIGGKQTCLGEGQRCQQRFAFPIERSPYRRYGFVCVSESSGFTLHKLARPGIAPTSCPGLGPTPMSIPPGAAYSAPLVGAAPLWVAPYLKVDATHGIWRFTQRLGWRVRGVWPNKFLWITNRAQSSPIVVTITDLRTSAPLHITVSGTYRASGTSATLDPRRPGHPDTDDKPETHQWGSTVFFPAAGCYRLDGVWQGGAVEVVFSFGR